MKGTVADLSNLGSKREAGTITAASFLEEFVDGTPWAHIDIAGTDRRQFCGTELHVTSSPHVTTRRSFRTLPLFEDLASAEQGGDVGVEEVRAATSST